jgi:hypothetical protein
MRFLRPFVFLVGPFMLGAMLSEEADADLIRNGSFEDTPGPANGQGILPSEWINVRPVGADTYSNDGSYGLFPHASGNFTGVIAYAGIRWIAGGLGGSSNVLAESFGQVLTTPLTPGTEYTLSANLIQAKRLDLDNPGGYHILLADGASLTTTVQVGSLDPTTDLDEWEPRELTFVAPTGAASLPMLVFEPYLVSGGGTYPGIDAVSLVPEPSTLALLCIAALGVFGWRRRE